MNPMLAKLMAIKGKKKEIPEVEKDGKLAALGQFSDMAKDAMGKKLGDGLKKVTVASNSPEGLKVGLNKAKEIVGSEDESDEDPTEEASETPEMEASEDAAEIEPCDEHSSPEEIDAEIERLMALKAQKEHAHSGF